MAKIPFDVKYKPQIESGEYKVETRSGKTARIVCWDRIGTPLVVLVGRGEEVLTYKSNGTTGQQMQLPSDLFIVTPEPKLSEFEIKVIEILYADKQEYSASYPESWKHISAELLAIARKEIEEELKEKVLHDYWKQTSDQCAKARKEAKAEALKDLPRWKKCQENDPSACVYNCARKEDSLLYYNGHTLRLIDLEKLPGFKEE